ncbi:GxxExxY protein [Bacteroidota bacterium]
MDLIDNLLYKDEAFNIIGAAMEVHRELGSGFLEAVYQEALEIELEKRSIPFTSQERLLITYKGIELKKEYIADFVCYNNIIVEIKALSSLTSEHQSQILNYLKATGSKLGLLINFGGESLEYKRLVH